MPDYENALMWRSKNQLLFSYLPDRTVNWEEGAGLVRLGTSRLEGAWPASTAGFVLSEAGVYLERWRQKGGLIDARFPSQLTTDRFTVGTPVGISSSLLRSALYCTTCFRFLPRWPRSASSLRCPDCHRPTLRQVGFVFVHGCGEMIPLGDTIPIESTQAPGTIYHMPIRCQTCGDAGVLRLDKRAERLSRLQIYCAKCGQIVQRRLLARCPKCFPRAAKTGTGQVAFQTAMRITRHSANNAYYPHHLTVLRLDRPSLVQSLPELPWLESMVPHSDQSANVGVSARLGDLIRSLSEAERRGDQVGAALIQEQIAKVATTPQLSPRPHRQGNRQFPESVQRSARESIAFLSTVKRRTVVRAAEAAANSASSLTERACNRLGLDRVEYVADLPVVNVVLGYSRRSPDATYEEEGAQGKFPTTIRPFPTLDDEAGRILGRPQAAGTVPLLAREGLHEGLALYLDRAAVVKWVASNGVHLSGGTDEERIEDLLSRLEPADRYYEDIWSCDLHRLLFGLLHSLSHCAMKALARTAGLEATSVSEHLFLPLLAAVVYSTATVQLGGVAATADNRTIEFLDQLEAEAYKCIYDPDCLHREGACHGCLHVPEIGCRAFNHGLSRSFLVGGRAPWLPLGEQHRIKGLWEITA